MLSLRPGKRVALLFTSVVVALLAAGTFLPVAYRRHQVCLRCGLYRQQRVFLDAVAIPWSERATQLTGWYAARIGKPHEHEWKWTGCGAMLNLWQMRMGYACGSGEPIAINPDAFGELLERLHPLELDRQAHAALTHGDDETRYQVQRSALEALGGTEEDLRAWWASTETALRELEAIDGQK